MIRTDAWQMQAIEELQASLLANEHILALALFGSTISSHKSDPASDLDILVVVSEQQFTQFFPNIDWLKPFGEVYAVQRFESELHGTIRICFFDFRRFDILVTTPPSLDKLALWESHPFWQGVQLLFSRSAEITKGLTHIFQPPTPKYPSHAEFEDMVNNFWFKAMLAGYKVLRDDRLIASHLALDLARECCVLGMILRDKATGTNIHHTGGVGNHLVDGWSNPLNSYTSVDILASIKQSATLFDQLASQWSATYNERRYPLLEWLEYIRSCLSTDPT